MKKLRLMIADSHALFREALRRILDDVKGVEIVGEARDGNEAVAKAKTIKPEMVLMEASLPRLNGIEATRQISRILPSTKVLMVTMQDNEDSVLEALRAGAIGYLLKTCTSAELIQAIRSVAAGDPFFSPSISEMILEGYLKKQGGPVKRSRFDFLTSREREVLQLIAEGNRNKEIASQMDLSVKTVEVHRAHLMGKLDFHNVADLVKLAIRKGLVKVE